MAEDDAWSPIRRVRTHEQVLAQIEQKILEGRLRVGEKLPSERDLVDALGVSRTSVREALRALEAMGIIEANVGTGTDAGSIVSGRSTLALSNLLRLHMALAQISLNDLVDIRIQLERNATNRAAGRCGTTEMAHLRGLISSMQADDIDHVRFNQLDTEFHVSIARFSGNALASDLMQALRDAVESEMTKIFESLDDWRAVACSLGDEHEAIVAAIEDGDGMSAAKLVDEHITNFYNPSGR